MTSKLAKLTAPDPERNNKIIQSLIKSHVQSEQQFPVDFDVVWTWLGYARKDSAVRAFLKCGFLLDSDYKVLHKNVENLSKKKQNLGGQPEQKLYITIEAMKGFCINCNKDKGKEIRIWYLQFEEKAKEALEKRRTPLPSHSPGWEADRSDGKVSRNILETAIKNNIINQVQAYTLATKGLFKGLWGKAPAAIKLELGLKKKDNLRDFLPAQVLRVIEKGEFQLADKIEEWGITSKSIMHKKAVEIGESLKPFLAPSRMQLVGTPEEIEILKLLIVEEETDPKKIAMNRTLAKIRQNQPRPGKDKIYLDANGNQYYPKGTPK